MKRRSDLLVGAVVLVVAAALIATVAWVKQANVGQRQRDVVARFRDVGNARVGNDVVIRGVVGGHIQAIELGPDGWVDVRMRVDPRVRLPSDPVVLLNESSLFGDWQATVIERTALPHDDAVQREIAEASHERGTLPGTALPGIGKLTAVAGQIAGDVATVAGRVEVAFDDQAARELRGSIRNVADLSTVLATVVHSHASDLDTVSRQLQTAIASLNRATGTVQLTAERVDSFATSPQIRRIVEDLTVGAAELRLTAKQVRELTDHFAQSQVKLDAFLATGDSVLTKINGGQGSLGLLVNDPGVYRRTDSLVAQLRSLVADIQANPKRYVSVKLF